MRLLLVALAALVVVLCASSLRHYDACQGARHDVLAAAAGRLPADRQAPAIERIRSDCRGAASLVSVSAVLQRQGRDAQAEAVAQEAVDAEPENAPAWNALARAAERRDPVTAQLAAGRAVALSPLDPPPVSPTPAGAGGP